MHGWVGQRRRGRELGANCGVSTVHQISLIQLSVVSLKRGIFSFKRENPAVVQLESASGVLDGRHIVLSGLWRASVRSCIIYCELLKLDCTIPKFRVELNG